MTKRQFSGGGVVAETVLVVTACDGEREHDERINWELYVARDVSGAWMGIKIVPTVGDGRPSVDLGYNRPIPTRSALSP